MPLVAVKQFASPAEYSAWLKAKAQPKAAVVPGHRVGRAPPPLPVVVATTTEPDVPKRRVHPGSEAHAWQIISDVCAEHRVTFDELYGDRRTFRITRARWAFFKRASVELGRWSTTRIAHFIGKDHTSFVHALKKAGVPRPRVAKTTITLEQRELMVRLYRDEQKNLTDTAREVGVGRSTVSRYLRLAGVPRRHVFPLSRTEIGRFIKRAA